MLRQFVSSFARRRLCLVADRSHVIRQAASSILQDLRFQVAEAEDSDEALAKYHTYKPDAVLIDGAISQSNEFSLLQKFKGHGPESSKLILCTHDRNPAHIVKAINAGAHEYMIKPFDRSIMTAKFYQLGLTG